MSPLPPRMRNRWANRTEPDADHGTIYWHVLMSAYPQARAAAEEAQKVLAHFPGLHMTPYQWLHITTLTAGETGKTTQEQMAAMVSEAQRLLRPVAPIPVTLNKILYHPEAIVLPVQPAEALLPILNAAQSATHQITGPSGTVGRSLPSWTPHMTISYSTTEQPVEPILSALGKTVRQRHILIDALTLVIQWGLERLWNWEPVGIARLKG